MGAIVFNDFFFEFEEISVGFYAFCFCFHLVAILRSSIFH